MTARGEMSLEQPSADTLKVILSGDWKLGVICLGSRRFSRRSQAGRGCVTWSSTPGNWPSGTPGC